jgi:transposase
MLTAAQIAEQLGISRRCFFDWMSALKAGGLAGLLERQHGGGAVPQVQGDALKELQAGLQSGRWKRAKEIQHWLRERHTIRLKLAGVYYWLGKLGGVLKVPRKTHAQKWRGDDQVAQSPQFNNEQFGRNPQSPLDSFCRTRILQRFPVPPDDFGRCLSPVSSLRLCQSSFARVGLSILVAGIAGCAAVRAAGCRGFISLG